MAVIRIQKIGSCAPTLGFDKVEKRRLPKVSPVHHQSVLDVLTDFSDPVWNLCYKKARESWQDTVRSAVLPCASAKGMLTLASSTNRNSEEALPGCYWSSAALAAVELG